MRLRYGERKIILYHVYGGHSEGPPKVFHPSPVMRKTLLQRCIMFRDHHLPCVSSSLGDIVAFDWEDEDILNTEAPADSAGNVAHCPLLA